MNKIIIVSVRPPALNAKGDQLVLWHRMMALIKRNIKVHLILYSSKKIDICPEIKKSSLVEITYLNHNLICCVKSFCHTFLSLLPLEARLFYNPELKKIISNQQSAKAQALIVFTSRPWSSVQKFDKEKMMVDLIDSYSLNYYRRPGQGLLKLYFSIQSKLHKKLENEISSRVKKIFVVSRSDEIWINAPNVCTIPNGVITPTLISTRKLQGPTIGFLGNMKYGPNKRAVKWFAKAVMPLILNVNKDAVFQIAGNDAEKLKISTVNNVQIIGRVESQFVFFRKLNVAVAPMLDGSGMQNKVLEAMSTGTPVVLTQVAANPIDNMGCNIFLVGETAELIAEHVLSLLNDPDYSATIGATGRKFVLRNHSWENIYSKYMQELGLMLK